MTIPARSQDRGTYLIVSLNPIHRHDGRLWADPLWAKDLEYHFRYIRRIVLACPSPTEAPPAKFAALSDRAMAALDLEPMPPFESYKQKLLGFPRFWWRLSGLLRRAEILHFTVSEFPIVFGIAVPWLRRRGRTGLFGVIEASFWRRPGARGPSRWLADLCERGARAACRAAHVVVATQEQYLSELTDPANSNHLTPAVWIDESSFIPSEEIPATIEGKVEHLGTDLRVGFFGRLMPEKGPDLLLEAVRRLRARGVAVHADFYGDGPFRGELERMAADCEGVKFWGMLAYGPEFFGRIRASHAMVLPARSDEYQRLLFDGFSQAVPIIASDSPGLDRVVDGEQGLRFRRGDASDLERALEKLRSDSDLYRRISRGAFQAAQNFSHSKMHKDRSGILMQAFGTRGGLQEFA